MRQTVAGAKPHTAIGVGSKRLAVAVVPDQAAFGGHPYDNTAGFVTGVALANLSALSADITETMWDDSGASLT